MIVSLVAGGAHPPEDDMDVVQCGLVQYGLLRSDCWAVVNNRPPKSKKEARTACTVAVPRGGGATCVRRHDEQAAW